MKTFKNAIVNLFLGLAVVYLFILVIVAIIILTPLCWIGRMINPQSYFYSIRKGDL
jgi:hypothetical protein